MAPLGQRAGKDEIGRIAARRTRATVAALCVAVAGLAGCDAVTGEVKLTAYGAHVTDDTAGAPAFAAQLGQLPACARSDLADRPPPAAWRPRLVRMAGFRAAVRLPPEVEEQRSTPAPGGRSAQTAWVSPRNAWLVLRLQEDLGDPVYTIEGAAARVPRSATTRAPGATRPELAPGQERPCVRRVGGRPARLFTVRRVRWGARGDTLHLTAFRLTLPDGRALYGTAGAYARGEHEELLAALSKLRIEAPRAARGGR